MINLQYIRAAAEAATGIRVSLPRLRELLVEEGLITQKQADEEAHLYVDYSEFFDMDEATRPAEDRDLSEGLPD